RQLALVVVETAQRRRRRAHATAPQRLEERGGGWISAVHEYGTDQRLADVGEDGGAAAAAGVRLGSTEPDCRAEADRPAHIGAGLFAHEIGETTRHFAFIGPC